MEDVAVLSKWRVGKFDKNRDYYETKEDHPLVATASRSEPMRSYRHQPLYSPIKDRTPSFLYGSPNNNLHKHDTTGNRKPACIFGGSEISKASSYTEGFSQVEDNEDDDATDVLVWNAPKRQQNSLRYRHRSLSDSSEAQSSCHSNYRKSSLSRRSKEHESVNVPEDAKSTRSDEINAEYESQLFAVAKQLEMIKSTQDSILTELSNDICTLQLENLALKKQNEHLTLQNDHLLQVINDLAKEVENLRQVFRTRNWPVNQNPENPGDISNETAEVQLQEPRAPSRRHSQSRQRKLHQRQSQVFEDVPLDDPLNMTPRPRVSRTKAEPGPGDDQVSTMSNRGRDRGFPNNDRSKSGQGCFRNLFKRKHKKRQRMRFED